MRLHQNILVGSTLVVALGLAGGSLWWYRATHRFSFPTRITSQTDFPLYYPAHLSHGLSLDPNKLSSSRLALTGVLQAGDKHINFSEQARPTALGLDDFAANQLSDPKTIVLPIGKATYGDSTQGLVASIDTNRTWILVTAPSDINFAQFEVVMRSFVEAR
jgi:hypothetical protein